MSVQREYMSTLQCHLAQFYHEQQDPKSNHREFHRVCTTQAFQTYQVDQKDYHQNHIGYHNSQHTQ